MQNDSNKNATYETCLFIHCAEGKTGTVSIATNNNKSCQFILKDGEIIAVSLARLKGFDAVKELHKVGIKGARFTSDLQLPFTEDARIESSETLLRALGYVKPEAGAEGSITKEAKPEETTTKKRMYRGQIIED